MNSKWQINRVGLLDFWYYDEEEFDFLDGRMLLRGANGSGKSVTMQSFIPLLLDGNMRRSVWIHLVPAPERWKTIFWRREMREKSAQGIFTWS